MTRVNAELREQLSKTEAKLVTDTADVDRVKELEAQLSAMQTGDEEVGFTEVVLLLGLDSKPHVL